MGKTALGETAHGVYILDPDSEEGIGSSASPLFVSDRWAVKLVNSETANDSDKHFTVLAGQMYQVLWVWVEYASSAAAGTRQLVLEIQDAAADVVAQFRVGVTQAASLTYYYMFGPSLADLTAVRDTDYVMTPIPPTLILPEGYRVRVYDNNNIAVAADDMVVQMGVAWAPM